MNAYQRVMNTLQGLPADRVPVVAVLGAYGGRLTGTDLRTLYSDAAAYVAGQRAVEETFGFDLVLAPFDYSAIAEAFGGKVAWFDNQPPNIKRPAVQQASEALALPLPDPRRTGRLPVALEAARQLAEIYRERVPLFAAVPGPCSLPALMMGMEGWLETVLFDEATARELMNRTGAFFLSWANALLEAGVTALIVTEAMAPAEVMPRALFVERMLPHMRAMFAPVRGPMIFPNSGGRINHLLDLLPDVPGVVGVGISPRDDLAESRRAVGPGLLLLGNLDNVVFPTATPEQIRQRSLACLRAAAPAGRYILANSGADIPLSTPPENLRAMIEASAAYAAGAGGDA